MKKQHYKYLLWKKKQQKKRQRKERRKANQNMQKTPYCKKYETANDLDKILKAKKQRYAAAKREVSRKIHKKHCYKNGTTFVQIEEEFGMENRDYIESYFSIAKQCIDFTTKNITFNLEGTTRIWPSGITLLCSLEKWIEIGRKYTSTFQAHVASTNSQSKEVNSYLDFCGFHNYVGRKKTESSSSFFKDRIVPITREKEKASVKFKEEELMRLLSKHSKMSVEQKELFDSIILTETFNNVIDHGIEIYGQGWWVLAQYHEKHDLISICIADNGIGVKNTLLVGPQSERIKAKIKSRSKNDDGEYLKLAIEENISGAFDASIEEGLFKAKYPLGARRGNGLKRIKKACKQLGIEFSILSHYGYIMIDENGETSRVGSFESRIFGGTMYTYFIKTGRVQ
jgi:hypothetical protein